MLRILIEVYTVNIFIYKRMIIIKCQLLEVSSFTFPQQINLEISRKPIWIII